MATSRAAPDQVVLTAVDASHVAGTFDLLGAGTVGAVSGAFDLADLQPGGVRRRRAADLLQVAPPARRERARPARAFGGERR